MAWTYDPSGLDIPLNLLRLAIGDTNTNDQQLQDEELEKFLALAGSVDSAAILAARALQAHYARSVDKWVGDLKILASQRARAYGLLVERLEAGSGLRGIPSAGGIRVGEKEVLAEDTDMVSPSFRRGMFDHIEE